MSSFLAGLGYFLLSVLFVGSGFTKVADPAVVAAGIRKTRFFSLAVSNGVPLDEGDNLVLFVTVLGASMIVASLMFSFGVVRRVAACFLATCVLGFSFFVHLNVDKPAETDNNNQAHILKNLAIVGALLVIAFSRGTSSSEEAGSGGSSSAVKKRRKLE